MAASAGVELNSLKALSRGQPGMRPPSVRTRAGMIQDAENAPQQKGLPFGFDPRQATAMAPLHSTDAVTTAAVNVTEAQWRDVTRRLAEATVKLSELEAQVDDLVEANLSLRHELSEATLALFLAAPHHDP